MLLIFTMMVHRISSIIRSIIKLYVVRVKFMFVTVDRPDFTIAIIEPSTKWALASFKAHWDADSWIALFPFGSIWFEATNIILDIRRIIFFMVIILKRATTCTMNSGRLTLQLNWLLVRSYLFIYSVFKRIFEYLMGKQRYLKSTTILWVYFKSTAKWVDLDELIQMLFYYDF